MSLYQEVVPFLEYLHSFRKLKNYFSFDLKFPQKWVIPKSIVDDGQVVPFAVEEDSYKGLSFVSVINEESIDITVGKILKIIKLNKEKELKEKLFKEYVEKLKSTFETNNIEKLKNLQFEFENNIPKFIDDEQDRQEPTDVELVDKGED